MKFTRHETPDGPRWALDGNFLPADFNLSALLSLRRYEIPKALEAASAGSATMADGAALAPLEALMEVWACGVTYLRSRDAREAESSVGDIYQRVYEAERPEIFYKAIGWRVRGSGKNLRIRSDSSWNVPEPELTLILNCFGEIIGYTAGNDLSSRSIEGENPLYLPQAKCFDGCCALGPEIYLVDEEEHLLNLPVSLQIQRGADTVFFGETSTGRMKRSFSELVNFLFREMSFPQGVALMTGTGIVPDDSFTLQHGDRIEIRVGDVRLVNDIT